MDTDTIQFFAIEVLNKGYYLDYHSYNMDRYYFDGLKPEITFHKDWRFIPQKPTRIHWLKPDEKVNYRYELIDKSFESEKTPLVFDREEVAIYDDDEYRWSWRDEYCMYESLYKLVYDELPPKEQEVNFDFNILITLEEIREHKDFAYKIQRTKWKQANFNITDGYGNITKKDVHHQLIDQIVFPNLIVDDKQSQFTSVQVYKIVREYIKDHIDGKYAQITSDYDFCFTVKKKIPLDIPESYTVDVNNNLFQKRKRKPKYETRYRKFREITIFEMTHNESNYQKYPVISGLLGENVTDLKEKMDTYLKNLITYINKPLVDCNHCHGMGVVLDKPFEVNIENE